MPLAVDEAAGDEDAEDVDVEGLECPIKAVLKCSGGRNVRMSSYEGWYFGSIICDAFPNKLHVSINYPCKKRREDFIQCACAVQHGLGFQCVVIHLREFECEFECCECESGCISGHESGVEWLCDGELIAIIGL